MPNKEGYFKEYYGENRGEISERRRERYANDPEYRGKVLQRSREYREEQRSQGRVRLPKYAHGRKFETGNGGSIELFTIGAFARAIGRSVQCVNHWERQGIMPKTPYRLLQGSDGRERWFRFYTREQANVVLEIIGEKGRLDPPIDIAAMNKAIMEGWRAAGVPVDCENLEDALKSTGS